MLQKFSHLFKRSCVPVPSLPKGDLYVSQISKSFKIIHGFSKCCCFPDQSHYRYCCKSHHSLPDVRLSGWIWDCTGPHRNWMGDLAFRQEEIIVETQNFGSLQIVPSYKSFKHFRNSNLSILFLIGFQNS